MKEHCDAMKLGKLIDLGRRKFDPHKPGEIPWDRAKAKFISTEDGMALYTLCKVYNIRRAIECGTASGYSAMWMAAAGVPVHTYDIHRQGKVWDHFDLDEPEGDIFCHVEDFGKANLPVKGGPNLFFIDGEHRTKDVSRDIDNVKQHLKPGDVVVFHDYSYKEGGVARAIIRTRFRDERKWKEMYFPTQRGMVAFYLEEEDE
jgi:hypothetical protein